MSENKDTEKFNKSFELIVAILLGLTAVLTAWASWQSSLYGGNQATKYTKGTAALGEANSMYSEGLQAYNADVALYNEINSLRIDLTFAQEKQDANETERLSWKLNELFANNVSEELSAAIDWADAQTEYVSPFAMEGLVESYYTDADAKYAEGEALVADGSSDNSLGDKLGLTTVIYAVVLFLLGVVNTFESRVTKIGITGISVAALIYAFVLMVSVPVLTL